MSVNKKTGSMSWPFPMGMVFPGANFATASVPLTQNITPVSNDGVTPDYMFNGIYIQADPDNQAAIFVCNTTDPPDVVAYSNVIAKLGPGVPYTRGKEWANNRDISKLFIGAINATDNAIVVIDQF